MNVIDFAPYLDALAEPIALVIAALIWRLAARLGIEMDRRALLDGIEAKAKEVVRDLGPVTMQTNSKAALRMASYAKERFPGAIRRLGLDAANALDAIIQTRLAAASLDASKGTDT